MKKGWIFVGIAVIVIIILLLQANFLFNSAGSPDGEVINSETSVEADTTGDTPDEVTEPASYTDVSAAEAKDLIDNNPDLIVIDVSPHYDQGHLPRAINYYPSSALIDAIPSLDPDSMYLIYCHADGPSRNGAQALVDAGFENVYRLDSHFGGWQAAGYEVEV